MLTTNYLFLQKRTQKIKYQFNKKLYKKRIFVEHTFQKLKVFRRIQIRYDSLINTYLFFLYQILFLIIFKFLIIENKKEIIVVHYILFNHLCY